MSERVGVRYEFSSPGADRLQSALDEIKNLTDKVVGAVNSLSSMMNKLAQATETNTRALESLGGASSKASDAAASLSSSADQSSQSMQSAADSTASFAQSSREVSSSVDSAVSAMGDMFKSTEEVDKALLSAKKQSTDLRVAQSEMNESLRLQSKALATNNAELRAQQQNTSKNSVLYNQLSQSIRENQEQLRQLTQTRAQSNAQFNQSARALQVQRAALLQVRAALSDAERDTKKLERAQKEQASATDASVKKLALWAIGARTAFAVVMRLRSALIETFNTINDGNQRLEEARINFARLKGAFVGAAVGDVNKELDFLNRLLTTASQAAIILVSGFKAIAVIAGGVLSSAFGVLSSELQEMGRSLGGFRSIIIGAWLSDGADRVRSFNEILEEAGDVFRESFLAGIEGADAMEEATEESEKFEKSLDSLIGIAQRFEDEMVRTSKALADISSAFTEAAASAQQEMFDAIADIEADLAKKIADINEDAADKRQDAIDKANASRARKQREDNDNIRKMMEQHFLEMEFARRRHQLDMLQNDEIFQFERSLLIARGDTVAIDELDQRHEIEQRQQEESFQLQLEQAEAFFQLQLRFQQEAARIQARELARALQDQLRDIEDNRQERIADAREAASERIGEEKVEYDERMRELRANLNEQIAAENEAHKERLNQLGRALAEYARENELTLDEITALWQSVYGVGGPIDRAVANAFVRYEGFVAQFGDRLRELIDSTSRSLSTARLGATSIGARFRGAPSRRFREGALGGRFARPSFGFQFGGETVVSSPTTFLAGEGQAPEKVKVEPLSPIGGNVGVSWRGGAIPIRGEGSMSGVDLSSVGDEIAQGLMLALQGQVLSLRGQRG